MSGSPEMVQTGQVFTQKVLQGPGLQGVQKRPVTFYSRLLRWPVR